MEAFDPRKITAFLLVIMTILQLCLVVHFWQTFGSGDEVGGAILIGIAAVMAAIEVFMLAVAADRHLKGLKAEARVWFLLFVAVLVVSAAAEYGAISHVTNADHGQRAQEYYRYEGQQGDLARLETEIASLQRQLEENDFGTSSAAIQSRLSAEREVASRYEAVEAQVPSVLLRRIARLETARITAEQLEQKVSERDALAADLRAREAAPQAEHPQFEAIAQLLGGDWTAQGVRTVLPALMVVVFKLVMVFGFWVISQDGPPGGGQAGGSYGSGQSAGAYIDDSAPDAGFSDQPPSGEPPSDGGEGRGGGNRPEGLPGNADLFDLFEQMDGRG